jgi:endonuclease/exonuclease/phosphatase family metal-dependent hydrolase
METAAMTRQKSIVSRLRYPIMLTVCLTAPGCPTSPRPAGHANPSAVRVITFNAQFLPGLASSFNKRPAPHYRAGKLAEKLGGHDIIGLNEMFDLGVRRFFLRQLARRGHFYCATPPRSQRSWLGIDSGLVIASRYPIIAVDTVVFSKASGFREHGIYADGFAAKGVLHARIRLGDTAAVANEIDVFISHLESRDASIRATQYDELSQFISRHSSPSIPLLILGDLNTPGGPVEIRNPRSSYHCMLDALGRSRPWAPVVDAWTCLRGGRLGGGTNNPLAADGGKRIDYILFSNSAGNADLHLVTVEVNTLADPNVGTLSDHAAVEATMRVRPGDRTRVDP